MALTVPMRMALSALVNHGEERLSVPPQVLEFVSFLNDGHCRCFGTPMDESQAVMAFMIQAWSTADSGRIPAGTEVTVRPSGEPAKFVKDGFAGVSIVQMKNTGHYMIAADDMIVLVHDNAASDEPETRRRGRRPVQDLAQAPA